jgi:hypothetical protein
MHTRGTLVQFGAEALIPTLQSASFFNELGPLVTALLVAGRVGAGTGAGIANMRVTEQIDAIESCRLFQNAGSDADCRLHSYFADADRFHGLRQLGGWFSR